MSMLERLVERYTELNRLREELVTEGMEIFERSLITIIRRYPAIEALWWTQYTPHFGDGSPRIFDVGSLHVKISGLNYEIYGDSLSLTNDDGNAGTENTTKQVLTPEQIREAYPDMIKELSHLGDSLRQLSDMLYQRFGDHRKIIATRDGVESEEFEHE